MRTVQVLRALDRARQKASAERRVGNDGDSKFFGRLDYFSLVVSHVMHSTREAASLDY